MKITQKGLLIFVWLFVLILFLKYFPQIGIGLAIITLLVIMFRIGGGQMTAQAAANRQP